MAINLIRFSISKNNFIFKKSIPTLLNNSVIKCSCLNSQNSFIHSSAILSKRRKTKEERKSEKIIKYSPKAKSKVVDIWKNITVADLAKQLDKPLDHVYEVMLYVNESDEYDHPDAIIYNNKVVQDIIHKCGMRFNIVAPPSTKISKTVNRDAERRPPADESLLVHRPPVVAIMGHVDHGKTTLLDSLRNTSIVKSEFGGITQHIGAFKYKYGEEVITFLDTPGHAAFTSMRSRGAHATDMVILVVAADDGVMEQTLESVNMAKEAQVPLIVAINKIDKPQADIIGTRKGLARHGVMLESEGGDIQSVEISALKKTNLNLLIEAILTQAELMNLRADPTGPVEGVIIESRIDTYRGKLATTLVQRGTLRKGAILVAGLGWCRVRSMFDEKGNMFDKALPSDPLEVIGWRMMPQPGDLVLEVESEKRANEVIRWREQQEHNKKQKKDYEEYEKYRQEHLKEYKAKLEKKRLLGRFKMRHVGPRQKEIQEDNSPKVNIIVKGDVIGSVEAILDVLETYQDNSNCALNLVHYAAGNISENDLILAETFQAIIYCFNVTIPQSLAEEVKKKNLKLKHFNVIYKMIDDLKEEISSNLPLKDVEEALGEAQVLQYFEISEGKKKVSVAGCRCLNGVLKKSAMFRVLRGEEILFEGSAKSLKHLKNEVESIKKDIECGLCLEDNIKFQPGDQIICYEVNKVTQTTSWDPGF